MTEPHPRSDGDSDGSRRVRQWLGAARSPTMPPEVAARLGTVLAEESRRRTELRDVKRGFPSSTRPRSRLETPTSAPRSPRRQPLTVALVAAVTAAAAGIAGYTLSASAGYNEPVADSVLRLSSSTLAQEAEAIAATRNLSAHPFSGAWRCARDVTDGRITGLAPAYVDETPALLVYTRTGGEDLVTVVTGCPGPNALARESVRLG